MKKALSLYLHFPFCMRKCRYCDFLSFPAEAQARQEYVGRLCREIRIRGQEFSGHEVQTVFFGGGTPSLLEPEQLSWLMEEIRSSFSLSEDAEISLECNPGTADAEKLFAFRRLGINRLSIGLQSADDRELAMLGRIHTAEQFSECFAAAREAGFDNINIDLMSGIPGQNIDSLRKTLSAVLKLRPEHLSVYSLIIEEGTPFWEIYGEDGCTEDVPHCQSCGCSQAEMPPLPDEETEREMVRLNGIPALPDEETERAMVWLTEEMLRESGYVHYEISNFALPGYECRHNLVYWRRGEYLGLGLGAASLIGDMRSRNTSDLETYLDDCCAREEEETLSRQAQMEETMFLGLRCLDGISIREFEARFGQSIFSVYGEVIERYAELGLLEQHGDRILLSRRGIDVSNQVLADFLL